MSFFQKAANLENTPIVHLSNLGHLAHKEAHEKAHGMAHWVKLKTVEGQSGPIREPRSNNYAYLCQNPKCLLNANNIDSDLEDLEHSS